MADDQAFLSARVPVEVRNRFKTLAASKGRNVQDLLCEVVSDYLREQQVPEAASIIATVRSHSDELKALGVKRLSLVGSVARGEATSDSDIDMVVGFEGNAVVSLLDLADIEGLLQTYLGPYHKVDLSLWGSLRTDIAIEMMRDAIEVL